jgi:DNA-binding transcriptional MerR regulator
VNVKLTSSATVWTRYPMNGQQAASRRARSSTCSRMPGAIGFTLADATDALAAHDAGGATCESERWRLQAVLDRVDAQLAELAATRERIGAAQQACVAGDCMFTGAS